MRQLMAMLIITLLSGCVRHIPLDSITDSAEKNEYINVVVQPNKIENSAFSDLRENDNLFSPPFDSVIKTALESKLKAPNKVAVNITEYGVYYRRNTADFIPFISLLSVSSDRQYLCKLDYTVMTDGQIFNNTHESERISSSLDKKTQIANYQILIKECLDGLTHEIQTQLDQNK